MYTIESLTLSNRRKMFNHSENLFWFFPNDIIAAEFSPEPISSAINWLDCSNCCSSLSSTYQSMSSSARERLSRRKLSLRREFIHFISVSLNLDPAFLLLQRDTKIFIISSKNNFVDKKMKFSVNWSAIEQRNPRTLTPQWLHSDERNIDSESAQAKLCNESMQFCNFTVSFIVALNTLLHS